jgi:hypothetical protein
MPHEDVPKSLILAASTRAEKTPVNTAKIFVGDRAEIYKIWDTAQGGRQSVALKRMLPQV